MFFKPYPPSPEFQSVGFLCALLYLKFPALNGGDLRNELYRPFLHHDSLQKPLKIFSFQVTKKIEFASSSQPTPNLKLVYYFINLSFVFLNSITVCPNSFFCLLCKLLTTHFGLHLTRSLKV